MSNKGNIICRQAKHLNNLSFKNNSVKIIPSHFTKGWAYLYSEWSSKLCLRTAFYCVCSCRRRFHQKILIQLKYYSLHRYPHLSLRESYWRRKLNWPEEEQINSTSKIIFCHVFWAAARHQNCKESRKIIETIFYWFFSAKWLCFIKVRLLQWVRGNLPTLTGLSSECEIWDSCWLWLLATIIVWVSFL